MQRIAAIIFARRIHIFIGGLLGFGIALVALAVATPKYSVSASIMLQMGREMTAPVTLNGSIAMPAEKRPEDIATAVEMMSGQDLIEQVVNSFGEDFFYPHPVPVTQMQKLRQQLSGACQAVMEKTSAAFSAITGKRQLTRLQKVIVAMQKDLTIEPARRSDVINLTLISTDPDKGKQLLDRFVDMYRQKHLAGYQTPQAREFFEKEHDRLGRELAAAEDQIVQFKAAHQVYSGDDQRKLLLTQQGDMQTSYNTLQVDEARVTAELADLQKSLDALPPDVAIQSVKQRNPLIDTLLSKLADAEANLAKVKSRYTDDSRSVIDATAEVNQLQGQLDRQEKEPFVTYSQTTGASDVRKALQADLLKEQSVLDGLHAEADLKQSQLAAVAARLNEVDSADSQNVRLTREVQLLEQSYKLYSKNLEDARISEAMDSARISNIAVTEPPTASPVPTYPPTTLWLAAGVVLGAAMPVAIGFAGDALRPVIRTREGLQSIFDVPALAMMPELRRVKKAAEADEIAQLCIDLHAGYPSMKTLLITGASPGAGTSTIAAAIVQRFTGQICRAKLVDIAAGRSGLDQAAADSDLVVVDGGTFAQSAATRLMVKEMDGVLMIAESDVTSIVQLNSVKERFARSNAKLLGTVLNRSGRYLPKLLRG